MPRPLNPERKNTPIIISKHLKNRFRAYAQSASNRAGNESDLQVLERIVTFYEVNNPIEDRSPKPTYVKKV